jgi:methionyl-tRNA synthetase
MSETHLDHPIEKPLVNNFDDDYQNHLDTFNFQSVTDCVWRKVQELDEKITKTEPFRLVKTDKEAAVGIIKELAHDLYLIGKMLCPIMPETSIKIIEAVLANSKPANIFTRLPE